MGTRLNWKTLLAAGLLAGACAGAHGMQAQSGSDAAVPPAASAKQAREIAGGDPVRWYREDATSVERVRTRRKEIGAAFEEARIACRQQPAAERKACLDAARTNRQKEMNLLRAETTLQPGS